MGDPGGLQNEKKEGAVKFPRGGGLPPHIF